MNVAIIYPDLMSVPRVDGRTELYIRDLAALDRLTPDMMTALRLPAPAAAVHELHEAAEAIRTRDVELSDFYARRFPDNPPPTPAEVPHILFIDSDGHVDERYESSSRDWEDVISAIADKSRDSER